MNLRGLQTFFKVLAGIILLLALPASRAYARPGPFAEIGPIGLFQIGGNERDFEPGVGAQFAMGYGWEKISLQGRMIVATQDDEIPNGGVDEGVEMVTFGGDMKLFFLPFMGLSDYPLQPYFMCGGAMYFLTEGSVDVDDDNASGLGGNLGFGVDWQVFEALSLGLENGYHFISLLEDTQSGFTWESDNNFALYFTTLAGRILFTF
jgi:hypothetical protein